MKQGTTVFIMMKSLLLIFIILSLNEVNGAIIKKAPAFAAPKYADSFIPAVMQVIFNGVEQYKIKQIEEMEQAAATSTAEPTTISHEPGQHQPTLATTSSELSSTEKPSLTQEASEVETEKPSDNNQSTPLSIDEKPELTAETPEAIYGTTETNHETPEEIHEIQEINQEMPQAVESNHEISDVNSNDKLETSTISLNSKPQQGNQSNSSSEDSSSSSSSSSEEEEKNNKTKKVPSIDSVVEEIYEIMKPKNKNKRPLGNLSSSSESDESNDEDSEEDENDENRFTMLGEKVTQVPRPSLTTYLKRSKLSSNCSSIQNLALLYDTLSKDARNQGFSKYTGYSDEVLQVLASSAEGGMGPQLKQLLEKVVERREITRADAKTKVEETLKSLNDPGSQLNRDLSSLLPLRFES